MGGRQLGLTFAATATSAPLLQLCIPSPEKLIFLSSCFVKYGTVGLVFFCLLRKRLLWLVLCFNTEKWSCILHNKPFFITRGLNSN